MNTLTSDNDKDYFLEHARYMGGGKYSIGALWGDDLVELYRRFHNMILDDESNNRKRMIDIHDSNR